MLKRIKQLIKKNRELVSYVFFGLATTGVNFLVYTVAILAGMEDSITPANLIAWVCAVTFAFFTNKLFVFESKSFGAKILFFEIISFLGARVLSGVLDIFLPEILVRAGFDYALFGVEGLAAKAAVSVAVIVLNYIFSKLVIFKKKKDNGEK